MSRYAEPTRSYRHDLPHSLRPARRHAPGLAGDGAVLAVFESPKALAGEADWGTPDELDAAFAGTYELVRAGLPLMWRDRWWRMFDREP